MTYVIYTAYQFMRGLNRFADCWSQYGNSIGLVNDVRRFYNFGAGW